MLNKRTQGFVLLCCITAVLGCVDAEQSGAVSQAETSVTLNTDQERQTQLAALDQQIRSTVGFPRASEFSQCRLLEVGMRACGGPEYYMAYSTQVTDEAILLQLVKQYNRLRQEHIEATQEVSTCEMIPRPQLVLEGGLCQAVSTSYM